MTLRHTALSAGQDRGQEMTEDRTEERAGQDRGQDRTGQRTRQKAVKACQSCSMQFNCQSCREGNAGGRGRGKAVQLFFSTHTYIGRVEIPSHTCLHVHVHVHVCMSVVPRFKNMVLPEGSPLKGSYMAKSPYSQHHRI